MLSAEGHNFSQPGYDDSLLWGPSDLDGPPASHLEKSFVPEKVEGAQNGVGVDAEHRRQILGLRNLLTWQCLAFCDGPSNLRCDLLVQQHRLASVDSGKREPGITGVPDVVVDRAHNNNDSSFMETLEAPLLIPVLPDPPGAEALFKEAQRRRRNRRLLGSGIVVAVLALAGLAGIALAGRGENARPAVPPAQPAFANTVIKATTASKGAVFSLVDRAPLSACASGTAPQVVVYRGSIDFVQRVMTYSAVDSSCPTLPELLTILTPTATYQLVGSNVPPNIGTDASRPWLKSSSSEPSGVFSAESTMLYPDLSALLRAVPGPLVQGRTMVIGGVSSTEYRGTTTLALLEHNDPAFVVGRQDTAVPNAAGIVIPIGLWVDHQGRLIRATASEPIFSDVYADGSTASGAQVTGTSTEMPPAPAISSPRQVGVANLILTFSQFGQKAIPLPSAAMTVPSGGQY